MKTLFYWLPRLIAIAAILFMMVFSIDCFDMSGTDILVCLFMHNIPAMIIAGILIIAWKWELPGGILFVVASVIGAVYFKGFSGNWGVLPIMVPFLVAGGLFIFHNYRYQKDNI